MTISGDSGLSRLQAADHLDVARGAGRSPPRPRAGPRPPARRPRLRSSPRGTPRRRRGWACGPAAPGEDETEVVAVLVQRHQHRRPHARGPRHRGQRAQRVPRGATDAIVRRRRRRRPPAAPGCPPRADRLAAMSQAPAHRRRAPPLGSRCAPSIAATPTPSSKSVWASLPELSRWLPWPHPRYGRSDALRFIRDSAGRLGGGAGPRLRPAQPHRRPDPPGEHLGVADLAAGAGRRGRLLGAHRSHPPGHRHRSRRPGARGGLRRDGPAPGDTAGGRGEPGRASGWRRSWASCAKACSARRCWWPAPGWTTRSGRCSTRSSAASAFPTWSAAGW